LPAFSISQRYFLVDGGVWQVFCDILAKMKTTTRRLLVLPMFVFAFAAFAFGFADVLTGIGDAIRQANSHGLAAYFDSNVQVALPDKEATYGKAQAEMVVRSFFANNPAKNFMLKHNGGTPNGMRYAVGQYMSTNGQVFRTYYVVNRRGNADVLSELRFEAQ